MQRRERIEDMRIDRKIAIFIAGFILAGMLAAAIFPREEIRNRDAALRVGAGDDISGILMEETVHGLEGKYTVSENLESESFKDC